MKLLAVPNLSEGRDFASLDRLQESMGGEVLVLDRHTDIDHHRAVFTIAGEPQEIEEALVGLGNEAIRSIDMTGWAGIHPAIGALDVCPVVWLSRSDRDTAARSALEVAQGLGDLGVPVFLYGELATDEQRRERAFFREGGLDSLWTRMTSGELEPDFGPARPHASAGAWLVTARPPLAAFNVELDTGDVGVAKEIAASIREAGGGLTGVRAIGLGLSTGRAQVSMNIHDPVTLPLGEVVEAVRTEANRHEAALLEAELIGLIPEAALVGYPEDVPIRDFDPAFHLIERRIAADR